MVRKRLDRLFKILYLLLALLLLFIAIFSAIKGLKNWSIIFWSVVILIVLLRLLQDFIYNKTAPDFIDIEEIEVNNENLISTVISKFKLGNQEEIINEENFKITTYVNKIGSRGLMYVKTDTIGENRMLIIKKHLDEFNAKYSGYRIYVYLDTNQYTREMEVMLKQFTLFTDRFKFIDFGLGDADNNILLLSYTSKDSKFRIGGTSYRFNINDYKKMKKEIKKAIK